MLLRVEQYMKSQGMLPPGSRVLAGVSGGADSVALLRALHLLRGKLGYELEAAHFNHGIRPEAGEDEAFVRALCEGLGVPLCVGRADVPALSGASGVSLEVAAREARHAFFRRAMAERGMGRLALAHHADDEAETVLLRLIRGTGPDGLGAMAPVEQNGIVRPFLCLGREEIRAWCRENGFAWREDATNADPSIPRNYVRLELMPRMREMNPRAAEALCRAAELLREDAGFFSELAREAVERADTRPEGGVAISAAALAALPRAVRGRALRLLAARAGLARDVEYSNIAAMENLLGEGMSGRRVELDAGFVALRESDKLVIVPRLPESPAYPCVRLNVPGVTRAAGGAFVCELLPGAPADYSDHPPEVQYFDAGRFPKDACARGRLPGDRFRPLNAPGGRKLKEWLIDRKVPRWSRDSIPVVASGGEVLWVVGMGISDGAKLTGATSSVLKITYEKGKGEA